MLYMELPHELKQRISNYVLTNRTFLVPRIVRDFFHIDQSFDHTKFFLIGVNEVTKDENIIAKFHALELPPRDEYLILFEATTKYRDLSGFVECLTTDADESDLDVIIIHPFDNRQNHYIKIAQSEMTTFPMTILLCDKYTPDAIVIDHITKEHWELLCKRFRGLINVLL